jgi:aminoacrylate hydrolase
MPLALLNNFEIYYETHGDGLPIVFIAGLGGAAASWRHQIEPFARHFKVITFDQRGTHRSGSGPLIGSVDDLASDTIALLDALSISSAHVVGHSTGGAIAQTLAIEHPDRVVGLALCATWPKSDAFFRYVLGLRLDILRTQGIAAYLRSTPFFIYPDWWINENWDALEASIEAGIANPPDIDVMVSRIEAILAFDRASRLPQISQHTLVLCARNDILVPPSMAEALSAAIPDAELVMLERGGHSSNQTTPAAYNETVLGFLSGV